MNLNAPRPEDHGKARDSAPVNSSADLSAFTDCFAVLDLPRRPWIEAGLLNERFQQLAPARHPDTLHGDTAAFTALNAAYRTLADPVTRLAHFLALEFPETPRAESDLQTLADSFLRVGSVVHQVNAFLLRRKEARGALAQALLAGEGARLSEEVRTLAASLEDEQRDRLQAIQILDADWERRPAGAAGRLSALHADLAFLSKWSDELRERSLRLVESPVPTT